MSKPSNVEKIVADIKKYVDLQMEYRRISGLEKAASSTTFIIYATTVLTVLFFFFIMANVWFAVFIAYFFDSLLLGFTIFMLLYLVSIVLMLVFHRPIRNLINNRFLAVLLDSIDNFEDDEEDK
ncbi:MAG: hypothetical protein ACPG5B_05940 [Chitinophagales bacterium]